MSFHVNYTNFYLTPCIVFVDYAHILAYLHDDRTTHVMMWPIIDTFVGYTCTWHGGR